MLNHNTKNFEKFYDELMRSKDLGIIKKDNILNATGWKEVTFKTYYSKKLDKKILEKIDDNNYKIINIEKYDKESFLRLMSQKQEKNETPFLKSLNPVTDALLQKARESATLAIDIYNRPLTKFKTEGYIAMMTIAWTSLFHSIFEEEKIDYYHYNKDGSITEIDGEKKYIDLSECIKRTSDINEAAKQNLIFLIGLRNKIEHRVVPSLDVQVCGECQSCLMNFEKLLSLKFGNYYSIGENLSIPLQLTNFSEENLIKARKEFQTNNYDEIKEYIYNFRESLDNNIYNSMDYCFKVYLIPKIANRVSSSDMSIEFLKMTDLTQEEKNNVSNAITLIKEKQVPVLNLNNYKPLKVCEEVSKKIGKVIGINFHTKLWKYYKVRNSGYQATGCNTKYCIYDVANNCYLYTDEWIRFLVDKLSDPVEFKKIEKYKI